jgi:hypothetical protein
MDSSEHGPNGLPKTTTNLYQNGHPQESIQDLRNGSQWTRLLEPRHSKTTNENVVLLNGFSLL